MPHAGILLAFFAALIGQALNTVAGGGSFVTFPVLLLAGVPPIEANATSTIALWPGALASAYGYRQDFAAGRTVVVVLAVVSAVGGLVGALLLLATPEPRFRALIPWLLGFATLVFALSGPLTARLAPHANRHGAGATLAAGAAVHFAVSVYGGYFGGGIGIMMLAAFALLDVGDIHAMNGLKALMGAVINGSAVVTFVVARVVDWRFAAPMIVAAVLSGYAGARLARRIDPKYVRPAVVAVGAVMTVVFALGR